VRLRDNGIPFVMTGYYSEEWAVCHAPDATMASFLVANSLLSRGKKNIVLFSGNPNLINDYLQVSGYRCALESRGIPFRQNYVSGQTYDYDAATSFIKSLLDRGEEVDAVMAFDDVMGAHIAGYLQSIGRGDIAVGGTSNY
jgi:LacI family transcriptional regulator